MAHIKNFYSVRLTKRLNKGVLFRIDETVHSTLDSAGAKALLIEANAIIDIGTPGNLNSTGSEAQVHVLGDDYMRNIPQPKTATTFDFSVYFNEQDTMHLALLNDEGIEVKSYAWLMSDGVDATSRWFDARVLNANIVYDADTPMLEVSLSRLNGDVSAIVIDPTG